MDDIIYLIWSNIHARLVIHALSRWILVTLLELNAIPVGVSAEHCQIANKWSNNDILGSGHTALHCCWSSTSISKVRSTLRIQRRPDCVVYPDARSLKILIMVVFSLILAVSRVRTKVVVGWPNIRSINPRIYFLLPINRGIKQPEIRSEDHSSSKYSSIRPRNIPGISRVHSREVPLIIYIYTDRKLSFGLICHDREFGVENFRSI